MWTFWDVSAVSTHCFCSSLLSFSHKVPQVRCTENGNTQRHKILCRDECLIPKKWVYWYSCGKKFITCWWVTTCDCLLPALTLLASCDCDCLRFRTTADPPPVPISGCPNDSSQQELFHFIFLLVITFLMFMTRTNVWHCDVAPAVSSSSAMHCFLIFFLLGILAACLLLQATVQERSWEKKKNQWIFFTFLNKISGISNFLFGVFLPLCDNTEQTGKTGKSTGRHSVKGYGSESNLNRGSCISAV